MNYLEEECEFTISEPEGQAKLAKALSIRLTEHDRNKQNLQPIKGNLIGA